MQEPDAGRGLRGVGLRLFLIGWFTGLLLQTGGLGVIDTMRRYQVTRSWWRGELEVISEADPFGVKGSDGRLHAWYGLGQSALMLPADLLAGQATKLAHIAGPLCRKLEGGFVAYMTFPLLTGAILVLAHMLLVELGFEIRVAAFGTVAWLFATSCLSYAQLHYENSLDVAMMLIVLLGTWRWAQKGERWALASAAGAAGVDLVTRAHTAADAIIYAGALLLAAPAVSGRQPLFGGNRLRDLLLIALPIALLFVVFDRLYQVERFGWSQVGTTYVHIWGQQMRAAHPELPPAFPFSSPFLPGLYQALLGRDRSIFLYDPLLVPTILLAIAAARRRVLAPAVRNVLLACALAWGVRVWIFVKFAYLGTGFWSSRYLLTPLQIALLFAVPLLFQLKNELSRTVKAAFGVVLVTSALVQISSVVLPLSLETVQAERCGRKSFILADRLQNLWHLSSPESCSGSVSADQMRVQFLPWSQAANFGRGVRMGLLVVWLSWLGALVLSLRALWSRLRNNSVKSAA